jgi:hypothetical protein
MTIPNTSNFLELRHASTDHAIFVVVPERTFFAIDGVGEPNGADFRMATYALRTAVETLHRRLRRAGIDASLRIGVVECGWAPLRPVPPADLPAAFGNRSNWHWRQMIELPPGATETYALAAIDEARRAAGRDRALIRRLTYTEGRAAQLLHVGPRSAEPVTVQRLFNAIDAAGLRPEGQLHSLLLADADAARNGASRSILRQPVA